MSGAYWMRTVERAVSVTDRPRNEKGILVR
jgi:hypothetical protein